MMKFTVKQLAMAIGTSNTDAYGFIRTLKDNKIIQVAGKAEVALQANGKKAPGKPRTFYSFTESAQELFNQLVLKVSEMDAPAEEVAATPVATETPAVETVAVDVPLPVEATTEVASATL